MLSTTLPLLLPRPTLGPIRELAPEVALALLPLSATITSLLTLTERPPPRLARVVIDRMELERIVARALLRGAAERGGVLLLR